MAKFLKEKSVLITVKITILGHNTQMNASTRKTAPNECKYENAGRRVLFEATDADQHAHNLTNWQQQYDQVGAGKFYGHIMEIQLEELQVFKEHTSQAMRQSCNVWSDSIWLGLPHDIDQESRINGKRISKQHIMCRPGDNEFELVTPANFDIYGLVVSQTKIINTANAQQLDINWPALFNKDQLTLNPKTLNNLHFILQRLLSSQSNWHSCHEDILIMAILQVFIEGETSSKQDRYTQVGFQHRKSVVIKAREFIRENISENITISQLCEITNVSRRTLQYSFETILGITPLQFLRISRLNGVRRTLHDNTQNISVSDIASHWGFWHLSQFSKDYKTLFGELPSQAAKGLLNT